MRFTWWARALELLDLGRLAPSPAGMAGEVARLAGARSWLLFTRQEAEAGSFEFRPWELLPPGYYWSGVLPPELAKPLAGGLGLSGGHPPGSQVWVACALGGELQGLLCLLLPSARVLTPQERGLLAAAGTLVAGCAGPPGGGSGGVRAAVLAELLGAAGHLRKGRGWPAQVLGLVAKGLGLRGVVLTAGRRTWRWPDHAAPAGDGMVWEEPWGAARLELVTPCGGGLEGLDLVAGTLLATLLPKPAAPVFDGVLAPGEPGLGRRLCEALLGWTGSDAVRLVVGDGRGVWTVYEAGMEETVRSALWPCWPGEEMVYSPAPHEDLRLPGAWRSEAGPVVVLPLAPYAGLAGYVLLEDRKLLSLAGLRRAAAWVRLAGGLVLAGLRQEETERRLRDLATVHAVTAMVAVQRRGETAVRQLLQALLRALRARWGWLVGLGQEGLPPMAVATEEADLVPAALGPDRGIVAWVLATDRPFFTGEIREDGRLPEPERRLYPPGSYLAVPLRLLGRPWGVLALGGKVGGGAFTEGEARWLAELAGHVTLVLENLVLFERLARLHRGAIRALARAIEAKDPYTHGHSERVAAMAVALGRALGLGDDELEVLEYGAWLHDVGKIGVPERVLCKPEALSPEEWALVRAHPELGVRILEPVRELARVLPVVRYHHEHYDGTGYPAGLKGESIPPLARIVHLVDALDAMTSDRAYRRALAWREALEELQRHSGRQFDARMVEKALSLSRELEGRRHGSE